MKRDSKSRRLFQSLIVQSHGHPPEQTEVKSTRLKFKSRHSNAITSVSKSISFLGRCLRVVFFVCLWNRGATLPRHCYVFWKLSEMGSWASHGLATAKRCGFLRRAGVVFAWEVTERFWRGFVQITPQAAQRARWVGSLWWKIIIGKKTYPSRRSFEYLSP